MSSSTEQPVQVLANALAHAQFCAFPEVTYTTRDHAAYRALVARLSKEELDAAVSDPASPEAQQMEGTLVSRSRPPRLDEIRVIGMFPQLWGSTALGFGGIGGQAMTTAYTIVLEGPQSLFAVYFNGIHAYTVAEPGLVFFDDMGRQRMAACKDASRYDPE